MKNGDVIEVNRVSIVNSVGGTTTLNGTFHPRITKSWHDYETGKRFIGVLEDISEIESAKESGTSKFKPEDYKKYSEEHYLKVKKAYDEFNPSIVYFSEWDIA